MAKAPNINPEELKVDFNKILNKPDEPETTVGEDILNTAGRVAKGAGAVAPKALRTVAENPMGVVNAASSIIDAPANILKMGYDILTSPASKTGDILSSPVRWGDNKRSSDQIQPGIAQGQPKQDAMSYFSGPMGQFGDADKAAMEQQLKDRYAGTIPGTQGVSMQEDAAREAYDVKRGPEGGVSPAEEATAMKSGYAEERDTKVRGEETRMGAKFDEVQAKTKDWEHQVETINKQYPALTYQEASDSLSNGRRFFTEFVRALPFGSDLMPSVEQQIRNMQADRDKLFVRDMTVLAGKEKATLEDLQVAMNRRMQMSDAAVRTYTAGEELADSYYKEDMAPLDKLEAKYKLGVAKDAKERAVATANQTKLNLDDAIKAQVFQNMHDPNAVPVGMKDGVPQFIVGYNAKDAEALAQATPHFKAVEQSIGTLMDMINKRKPGNRNEMDAAYDIVKAEAEKAGFGTAGLPKTFTGYTYDDSKIVTELASAFKTYQNAFYMSRGHAPYLDKRLLNIISKPKGGKPSASTYATSVTGG